MLDPRQGIQMVGERLTGWRDMRHRKGTWENPDVCVGGILDVSVQSTAKNVVQKSPLAQTGPMGDGFAWMI